MKSSIFLGATSRVMFDPAVNGQHMMLAFKLKKPININGETTDLPVVVLDIPQIKEMAESLVALDKVLRKKQIIVVP